MSDEIFDMFGLKICFFNFMKFSKKYKFSDTGTWARGWANPCEATEKSPVISHYLNIQSLKSKCYVMQK